MANASFSYPTQRRFNVASETKIVIAALVVAWFAIVAVLGVLGRFVTAPGMAPLPILLGVLAPIAVFFVAYLLSQTIREYALAIDPRLMLAIQAWRFAGIGFLALYVYGVLPGFFAWPAGLVDIAIGVTAPLLLTVLLRKPRFAASRTFVIWNLLGILDLVVALSTGALGAMWVAGPNTGATTGAMAHMPLVLIPVFFVPIF